MAQFFNELVPQFIEKWLASWLGGTPGPDFWLGYLLAAAVHIILLIHVVAVGALIFIWLERKVAGRIQDRLGPTRVGGKFGWLQTLADGIKLVAKEDITPKDADALLFKLAPYVSFAASFTAYMALPFANGWAAQEINVAVFFIVAVLGLEVFGVILAGYASGSKWSLFGGMREAAQVVSYEVPIGLCVVVPVMIVGSMNLVTIGEAQAGLFTNWLIFHDPFTFLVFWVYFTCAVASVNRAPFDLAEAESELVAGFHTEYSGLRWSFFFMAEYGSMFLVSGLAAILFFGGWNGPIPIFRVIGWSYEQGEVSWTITGYLAQVAGVLNFILKAVVGVVVMMWVRWTLPRLRIDQVMTTCLKYCVPLAAFCFVFAMLWKVADLPSPHDLAHQTWGRSFAETRESWVLAKQPAPPPATSEAPRIATALGDRPMMLLAQVNWHSVMFLVFALIACGFAAAVVLTPNVVRMAFYLTLSLGATAGLFFLAGAQFVGAMQLMIYVGGTLVLLIFGVMLTAQARFISMQTHAGEWVAAAVLGSALLGLLLMSGLSVKSWNSPRADLDQLSLPDGETSTPIGFALSGVRVDKLDQSDARLRGGMSGYLFPFVIISMHLLVVLIGAGYMARTKRARSGALPPPAAAPRVRSRKFAVTAGLLTGIAVNLVLAILCFAWYFNSAAAAAEQKAMANILQQVQADLIAAPDWLCIALGSLLLLNVLLLVIVYFWQSWGVVGLVVVPFAAAYAVSAAGLATPYSIATLILLLLPVVPLIVLICSGPRPTMWEQMD